MSTPEQPNIILIHTDQHRGDCLGITGRRKGLFTPHMDAIGRCGAHFTSAYATCPVCIPQRITLMSGQLETTHGVLWNVGIPEFPFTHTLPGELAKGGYQTAHVGRTMHLRPEDNPYGFQHYVPGDPSCSHPSEDRFFQFVERHAPEGSGGYYGNGCDINSVFGAPYHLPDWLHHSHWTTTQAIEFLEHRDPTRPYFLSVGFFAPHGPQNPPPFQFNRYYNMQDLDEPAIGDWAMAPKANWLPTLSVYCDLKGELLRCCRAGYYGNISFIDQQLGRLLHAVNLNNTYMIFTADHGEMLGDHYRYHKCTGYEGSAHIPMLIAGPGIPEGTVCDQPVGWHDLLPTIMDMADLPCPDAVDGSSMMPLMTQQQAAWRDYLSGACTWGDWHTLPGQVTENNLVYEGGHHFVTDGKRKFLWHPKSGAEQFFDLVEDPDECRDLIGDPARADEISRWRGRLIDALKDRPEGFSDGTELKSGRQMKKLLPHAQELCDQRIKEGYDILYYYTQPDR